MKFFKPDYIFLIIIFFAIFIHYPGLSGGFLFDDYPNLQGLENKNLSNNSLVLKEFIFSGSAGPAGRPISLLTFALQSESWPDNPRAFKLVNIIIHILCGILLYISTVLILKNYGFNKNKIKWIALFSTSIWLLHPFFVSTTLYVIQRMTQLPALFSLLGIIGYLKGKELLLINKIKAYCIMTVSIGLATILATFSKENGALLPLLIFVIEFCNPNKGNQPNIYWRTVCLWLPSIAITVLLLNYIDFSKNPWPNRNFNQIERLLSETRIITNYLYNLYVPRIEGHGLFQDGYVVSRGWFEPITTFLSFIFLILLLLSSIILKNKYPLYSLAILFYFSAQLIESTFIGLELYFEHRNYLSALFLFLPVACILVDLNKKINFKAIFLITVVLFSLLMFMTYERVKLWSNTQKLQIYWAQNNLNSNRAQVTYANILWKSQKFEQANHILVNAIIRNPSSTLYLQLLNQKIQLKKANSHDFILTRDVLINNKIDGEVVWQIRWLVSSVVNDLNLSQKYTHQLIMLLQNLNSINNLKDSDFSALMKLLTAQLYASIGEERLAFQNYKSAIQTYNNVNSSLAVATDCANRGYKKSALNMLVEIEKKYSEQLNQDLHMKNIFDNLKASIERDLQYEKIGLNYVN